jgi:hypothetical protein
MSDESKTKDSRDRSKPDAPEGAVPENDQRRFRGQQKPGDDALRNVAEGETSGDAPTDPADDAFLKTDRPV